MSKISKELDELQKGISDIIVRLIVFLAITTIVWAILHLVFVLPVTWLQVFGAFILFNLVTSFFR